jgi:hypothetical protein
MLFLEHAHWKLGGCVCCWIFFAHNEAILNRGTGLGNIVQEFSCIHARYMNVIWDAFSV